MRAYVLNKLGNARQQDREFHPISIRYSLTNKFKEHRGHRLGLLPKRFGNLPKEERAHRLFLIHERLANESDEQRSQVLPNHSSFINYKRSG